MEKMLMNPYTGSVDTEENWRADFAGMTPEEWVGIPSCLESFSEREYHTLDDGTIYLHMPGSHLHQKTISGMWDGKWGDGSPITFEDAPLVEVVPDDDGGWKEAD